MDGLGNALSNFPTEVRTKHVEFFGEDIINRTS